MSGVGMAEIGDSCGIFSIGFDMVKIFDSCGIFGKERITSDVRVARIDGCCIIFDVGFDLVKMVILVEVLKPWEGKVKFQVINMKMKMDFVVSLTIGIIGGGIVRSGGFVVEK